MEQTTLIQVNQADLNAFFTDRAEKVLVDKYAAVEVSTPTVCEIWGIAKETLSNYVRQGKVIPINPGSSKYRFRLSDILSQNPRYKHA